MSINQPFETSGPMPGTVTVTGTGWADAAPDLMVVAIGVESRAPSVDEAYTAAGRALSAVAATFKGNGVAPADIRTTGLGVRADLVWRDGEGQRVAGYIATSSLSVQLRDMESASATVSAAAAAGGNDVRLHNLQLAILDDAAVRAGARDAAWRNAQAAASQFAALASARLGRVVSVAERGPAAGPMPVAGLQRAAAVESVAIEAGEDRVEAAVTVVWELVPES